jgi:FkbM family methyltransferase
MEGAVSWGYYAPDLGPGEVYENELFIISFDVSFKNLTSAKDIDELSQWLAKGIFPESYNLMVRLLRALAPEGGRVLDLGAHVGMFALAAAAAGYEVLAVEASPRNAALLRASIERNGFDRLRLVHAAVSDRPGVLEFCQAGPYGHVLTGASEESVKVPAIDVDRLLAEHGWDRVDFVKMDIEGSEGQRPARDGPPPRPGRRASALDRVEHLHPRLVPADPRSSQGEARGLRLQELPRGS